MRFAVITLLFAFMLFFSIELSLQFRHDEENPNLARPINAPIRRAPQRRFQHVFQRNRNRGRAVNEGGQNQHQQGAQQPGQQNPGGEQNGNNHAPGPSNPPPGPSNAPPGPSQPQP